MAYFIYHEKYTLGTNRIKNKPTLLRHQLRHFRPHRGVRQ